MHSSSKNHQIDLPLTGEKWAAKSEAYAALIDEHLSPTTVWLDAGCGRRLLEEDMDRLEDWLAQRPRLLLGLDPQVTKHCNIELLVRGSLYDLPFADSTFDLVTANMVAEHLANPLRAFLEIARCLSPNGALILKTPNLLNYGVMVNAIASKVIPEKWRLGLVHGTDDREAEEFFPVRYKANRMSSLRRLLQSSGLQIHKTIALTQQQPFSRRARKVEEVLMKLTPVVGLLVCAHKAEAA
jgi:SAM-dependent methyltransferase